MQIFSNNYLLFYTNYFINNKSFLILFDGQIDTFFQQLVN